MAGHGGYTHAVRTPEHDDKKLIEFFGKFEAEIDDIRPILEQVTVYEFLNSPELSHGDFLARKARELGISLTGQPWEWGMFIQEVLRKEGVGIVRTAPLSQIMETFRSRYPNS